MSELLPPLVIGVGSPHGDDQAGWVAAERLRAGGTSRALCVRDVADLILGFAGEHDVVFIDASVPLGTPGRVLTLTWPCSEWDRARLTSTHGLGLIDALEIAETLGHLPERVTIVAVEAGSTAPGAPLSVEVASAINNVVDQLSRGQVPSCTKPH